MRKIWILTLFPEFVQEFLNVGVIGQALSGKRGPGLSIEVVNIREYGLGKYKAVDDGPYGGGPGMILRADCLANCLEEVVTRGGYGENFKEKLHCIFTSARGRVWQTGEAKNLAAKIENESGKDLLFLCGRYEGVDERFLEKYIDEEFCLGEFILSGGELAVLTIIDTSLRYVDGILGNKLSSANDSFSTDLLEYPQYTRPEVFEGMSVPEVLKSGHHKNIEQYQKEESLRITKKFRPDLLERK